MNAAQRLAASRKAQRAAQDRRAEWLGYRDADEYLDRAQSALGRFKRPPETLIRHYRFIFDR